MNERKKGSYKRHIIKNLAFLTVLYLKKTLSQANMGSKYEKVFLEISYIQVVPKFSPIQIRIGASGWCIGKKQKYRFLVTPVDNLTNTPYFFPPTHYLKENL